MARKRPDRSSGPPAEQGALFGPGPVRKGRVEAAVDKAVRAGYADDVVSATLDAGMVALARTLARQLDLSARTLEPWVMARLSGELRAVLAQLRLDPTSRGGMRRDEFADLVASLRQPSIIGAGPVDVDPGGPEVAHPADP